MCNWYKCIIIIISFLATSAYEVTIGVRPTAAKTINRFNCGGPEGCNFYVMLTTATDSICTTTGSRDWYDGTADASFPNAKMRNVTVEVSKLNDVTLTLCDYNWWSPFSDEPIRREPLWEKITSQSSDSHLQRFRSIEIDFQYETIVYSGLRCPIIKQILNGYFAWQGIVLNETHELLHSQNASLHCDDGFRPNGEEDIANCHLDANYIANWTYPDSSCTVIQCSQLYPNDNTNLTVELGRYDPTQLVNHSTIVDITCGEGYLIPIQNAQISCILNDTIKSASWNHTSYNCTIIQCPRLYSNEHTNLTIDVGMYDATEQVNHSTIVHVTCGKGYLIPIQNAQMSCVLNDTIKSASWNHTSYNCTKQICQAFLFHKINDNQYQPAIKSLEYGDTVSTNCTRGFSGNTTVACDVRENNELARLYDQKPCVKEFCNTSTFNITPVEFTAVDNVFTLVCPDSNLANNTCLWDDRIEQAYWENDDLGCPTRQTTSNYLTSTSISTYIPTDPSTNTTYIVVLPERILPATIILALTVAAAALFRIYRTESHGIESETMTTNPVSDTMIHASEIVHNEEIQVPGSETITNYEVESESEAENDVKSKVVKPSLSTKSVTYLSMKNNTYPSVESRTSEGDHKTVSTDIPSNIPLSQRKQIDPRAYDQKSYINTNSNTHTPSLTEERYNIVMEVLFDIKKGKLPDDVTQAESESEDME